MERQYNNGLFDARNERLAAEAEAKAGVEQTKANALLAMANKPASGGNKALIIIPVAVILLGGVIAIIMLKKKK